MDQQITNIDNFDLLNKVADIRNKGYRLVQICAVNSAVNSPENTLTKPGKCMLLYSFFKDGDFFTLRIYVDAGEPVESISRLYSYSYLYENEIHDLFGINMINMRINYNGHFYETSIKTPFNPAQEKNNG